MATIYNFNKLNDFIDCIEAEVRARRLKQRSREAAVSTLSGERRMLVRGRGWIATNKITFGDRVKTKSGKWIDAAEVNELQEVE